MGFAQTHENVSRMLTTRDTHKYLARVLPSSYGY